MPEKKKINRNVTGWRQACSFSLIRLRSLFMRFALACVVLPVFFINDPVASAQESHDSIAPQATQTLRSSARLVVLDVVVTDKAGNPVNNLAKNDFTIVEDGVSQSVASFEASSENIPTLSARSAKSGAAGIEPRVDSTRALNIIVLDELNSEFLDQAHGRVAVDKFLRTHGARLSEPTALLILGQSRLEVLHDYTQDPTALLQALKKRHAELAASLLSGEMRSSPERFNKTLAALSLIADANRHYAGRKNVLWIGPGFPSLNSNYYFRPEIVGGVVQDASNMLLDARMVVYTLDPRGLEVTPVNYRGHSPGGQMEGELLFEEIAPETGGRIFRGRNDIDVAIASSIRDGSSYYTLSYYPTNRDWNGKFRKVQIVMNRQGMAARTRLGYFSLAETPADDAEMDTILSRAVVNPLSYHALSVQAFVKPAGPQPDSRRFKVYVGRQGLDWRTLDNGDHRCEVTIVQASLASDGKVISHTVKELEGIVTAKKFAKDWDKPMAFEVTSDVPRGSAHYRIVVRDSASGDLGTADLAAQ
jgi:VWFA-related protein